MPGSRAVRYRRLALGACRASGPRREATHSWREVGLPLQDTLANLFADIHIIVSRQVRPGDYVRLESGEEGYVQNVTWRYTTIGQLPTNLTIIPNAKLASAVITNFHPPDQEPAVLVPHRLPPTRRAVI